MAELNGSIPEDRGSPMLEVPPGLVPTQYVIEQVGLANGMIATILSLYTPTGVHITFWPEDSAVGFGKEMLATGQATKSGLILPEKRR